MNERLLFPELELKHAVRVQTRFSDYDTFGHVNNNAYMAYFDLGKVAFFNRLMGRECSPADLSAVIVNINVDFLSPAPFGTPLDVLTAVVHIGDRSFTVYQRIVNPHDGTVCAQATTTLAGFDIATQQSAPLSEVLVAALGNAER